ncbi:MAG: hypothetical protein RJA49_2297 [Actinomycetota bacterium]
MNDLLDLTGPLPSGRLVVEASAGTGKTYSLSALVVRHVAERGIPASSLLVVTFTRAAAAELRDRTRAALVKALEAVRTGVAPPDQQWMAVLFEPEALRTVRESNLRTAIATFDDATITTIHGFCQQALRQLGLRAGTGLDAELGDSTAQLVDEVCRDLVVAALVDDPTALDWPGNDLGPSRVLNSLKESVTALLGNPGAVAVPQPGTATPKRGDTVERLERWVALVHRATHEVGVRRRARQELGYDDLITGLRDAVQDPAVAATLNDRYELVLVDEFQDTDPVQWEIFDTTFTRNLVTVGDPKQAIYRFRGADVQAYLAATAGAATVHLGTNFRSDARLVQATNALIRDVHLGDPRIVGAEVAAAPHAAAQLLRPGAPLEVRRVPDDPALYNQRGFSAPLARRSVVADLVREVVELLTSHHIGEGADARPVRPGDIAVLVPSHANAAEVVRGLDRARVPSVRTRTGSVLETPAADQWSLLLAALERPSHSPTVRAAGLSAFLHQPAAALDPLAPGAEMRLAVLQRQCAAWAEVLASRPFLAWYDRVRADSELVPTLLAAPGGERQLTDVDHVAELLATELTGNGTTAAAARRTLERLRAEVEQGGEIDAQMRRIDSDAQAVQITTLHGSKGLEYPVVLLPFSWQVSNGRPPTIYNDHDTGVRAVDIATNQGWHGPDLHTVERGRKHHAAVGERGDRLRLLYVGLTRAEQRTVVWWAPAKEAERSALNVLLFDRDEDGVPLHTEPRIWPGPSGGFNSSIAPVTNPTGEQVDARLEQFAERSAGAIAHAQILVDTPRVRWTPATHDADRPPLSVAATGGRQIADRSWRRWSFTSITKTRDQVWVPTPMITGGTDEPEEDAAAPGAPAPRQPALEFVTVPLADVVAGASFGTLVHTVLERVDPVAADLEAALDAEVQLQLRRDRLDVDPEVLVAGLAAALRTSLGPIADGRRLADIPGTDRLAELEFDLPLGPTASRVTAAQIGAVLLDTLPDDDPQRHYAQELADGRFVVELAGFLQGSIDAVLRIADPACGHRFVVVDYKTNRLHERGASDPLAAYHPDVLPAAMAHHDYPLQSLLYSVALHRYLRWRLPGYSPEAHLGGVAYLFVRGMVGPATPLHGGHPSGVFAWRPPAATVVALDRLLAGGGS